MKYVFTILLLAAALQKTYGQETFRNPDIPMSNDFSKFTFVHIISKLPNESNINVGDTFGTIEKFPEKFSQKFDNEVRSSINYYKEKDFQNARTAVERALNSEPDNPFILNAYARACYQIDKITSYNIYKRLITNLDSTSRSSNQDVAIDLWFTEAYWKLGTLHMDNKEWQKAKFEISRFMMGIADMKGQYIYEQALQYLTECYYELYEDKIASHLAKRVLIQNPDNEYAKAVLAKIK